jgi:hypothetical protein
MHLFVCPARSTVPFAPCLHSGGVTRPRCQFQSICVPLLQEPNRPRVVYMRDWCRMMVLIEVAFIWLVACGSVKVLPRCAACVSRDRKTYRLEVDISVVVLIIPYLMSAPESRASNNSMRIYMRQRWKGEGEGEGEDALCPAWTALTRLYRIPPPAD